MCMMCLLFTVTIGAMNLEFVDQLKVLWFGEYNAVSISQ